MSDDDNLLAELDRLKVQEAKDKAELEKLREQAALAKAKLAEVKAKMEAAGVSDDPTSLEPLRLEAERAVAAVRQAFEAL